MMMNMKLLVAAGAVAVQAINIQADSDRLLENGGHVEDREDETKSVCHMSPSCKKKYTMTLLGIFGVCVVTIPFVAWFDKPEVGKGPAGFRPVDVCKLGSDRFIDSISNAQNCKVITTNCQFRNTAGVNAEVNILDILPNLELIQGDLDIRGTSALTQGLEKLSMTRSDDDRKVRVQGRLTVDQNPDLQSLNFDALESIGANLDCINNENLEEFSMAGLTTVEENILINSNPQLTEVNLENLDYDATAGAIVAGNGDSCACNCPEEIGDTC